MSLKYVVTGGGGFVGKALAFRLKSLGHEVVSVSRKHYQELEDNGIQSVQADLSAPPLNYASAFSDADGVFHVAAKVDMWGKRDDFYAANVTATKNILLLCKEIGIRKLIYTSSPSVIADHTDLCNIDESRPYPKHHTAYYPETKAIAERAVLSANSNTLWTLSLRPHLIWGPGDTNLVPAILKRARTGRLVRVGSGKNKTDVCYIEDCAQAHLCALDALERNPECRGRAYFISQGETVELWGFIDEILKRHGCSPVEKSIPLRLAMTAASVLEFISRCCPGNPEPLLTRFLVNEMATSHYFDISAARKELGFEPRYSVQQALEKAFPAKSATHSPL